MVLTEAQLLELEETGFVAPLALCPPAEMARIRQLVDAAVLTAPGPHHGDPHSARHQDCRVVYDLCAHPSVTEAVADVLGPDVLLWNSVLMNKAPGAEAVPWHQDRDFEFLDPDESVAVWLALDDATVANGCLQMIPGSHRRVLPATLRTRPDEFDSEVGPAHTAERPRAAVELLAGEFVLFYNKILHHSAPNRSADRRLGLAARYTTPSVRVNVSKLFDGCVVYPVLGTDRYGFNPTGEPPKAAIPAR
jgi:hypothetical protein